MTFSGPIVVGHDGSSFANKALEWALDLAQRTGASVRVVRSWTMRTAPRPATQEIGYVPPASDFQEAVAKALASDIAPMLAKYADVQVEVTALRGQPANVLLQASEGASLLAVGPRGLGGFKGLMLGSVSDYIVSHASCPVVVVRGDDNPSLSEPADPS